MNCNKFIEIKSVKYLMVGIIQGITNFKKMVRRTVNEPVNREYYLNIFNYESQQF